MADEKGWDVVVVGGGLGGLLSATLLAKGKPNRRVLLLERAARAGGRAASQVEPPGHVFNLGPHAVYRAGPAAALLRRVGIPLDGEVVKGTGGIALKAGRLHTLPAGPVSLLTTDLVRGGGRFELAGTMARLLRKAPQVDPTVSIDAWLEESVDHDDVRDVIRALFRLSTYSTVTDRLSAPAALMQLHLSLAGGVVYLHGGWQSLVDAARARAEEAGVKFEAHARVGAVNPSSDGVEVSVADGRTLRCSAVVLAVGPDEALRLLPAKAQEELRKFTGTFLWNLCYRMTGVAADADDLVQETFARALRRPPPDTDRTLRPWLTRIAVNAARDVLRTRRRAGYVGPWLPSPIDPSSEPPAFEPEVEGHSTEGRYELLESASFAFLLALETLNPKQRAVLLLRDVFDYPVEETAEVLELSPANVKVLHHRARKRLEEVHRDREVVSKAAVARNLRALEMLMGAIVSGDATQVERLLASDVVLLNDGGGQFHAARVPVLGAKRVATFLLRLSEIRGTPDALSLRMLNGQPALVLWWNSPGPHEAPLSVMRIEVDASDRVREVHSVLATRKLTAVHPPDDGPSGV